MRKILLFLAIIGFTGAVHAQMFKWLGPDGKVRYGDTPPPGVKATPLKGSPSGSSSSVAPASKGASKGPMTSAEQEQAYRKRQQDARKASEKSDQENQAQAAKKDACERSREYLSTLQSGERITRTNPSGERYYLDENKVAQEIGKAQQSIQQACK